VGFSLCSNVVVGQALRLPKRSESLDPRIIGLGCLLIAVASVVVTERVNRIAKLPEENAGGDNGSALSDTGKKLDRVKIGGRHSDFRRRAITQLWYAGSEPDTADR